MCVTICWFFLQDDRLKLPNVTSIDEVSEKRTVERYVLTSNLHVGPPSLFSSLLIAPTL